MYVLAITITMVIKSIIIINVIIIIIIIISIIKIWCLILESILQDVTGH